jgi:hypothetical protein
MILGDGIVYRIHRQLPSALDNRYASIVPMCELSAHIADEVADREPMES